MVPLGCPTVSVTNYHYTLGSILDKCISQRGRNLQYWFFTLILGLCILNKFNFIIFITKYYLQYIIALRFVRFLLILADEAYCTQNLVSSPFTNYPLLWANRLGKASSTSVITINNNSKNYYLIQHNKCVIPIPVFLRLTSKLKSIHKTKFIIPFFCHKQRDR